MKSLVKFLTESSDWDNNLVTLVNYKGAPGIIFGTESNEYPPEVIAQFREEFGWQHDDTDYDKIDTPVFFWNLYNTDDTKYVSRKDCKPLL